MLSCSCLCCLVDIKRTYPENIYFKEIDDSLLKPLSNVLTAYAAYNPHIGYCQVNIKYFLVYICYVKVALYRCREKQIIIFISGCVKFQTLTQTP